VFDNIVNNAKKYGFTNADNPYNRVGIKFSLDSAYDKPQVLIQIMNNGAPLVNNLKPEKIFEWGVGIGTGLGGWHIRRLVEHFGGKVTLCQYDQREDNDYTLGYEISLPLILK
jgi:nitrogen fixation/metabolism regulation signal transduction histidine kinase